LLRYRFHASHSSVDCQQETMIVKKGS
jgi:hypothetical protein